MDADKIVSVWKAPVLACVEVLSQMVLDAGRIVEFGKPSELLQITDGKLKGLVDESGDKEGLYKMAGLEN